MIIKIGIIKGTSSESIEINTDSKTTDQQKSETQKSDIKQKKSVNYTPKYAKCIRYLLYGITTFAAILSIIYMLKNLQII
jgi:hypothetical protein